MKKIIAIVAIALVSVSTFAVFSHQKNALNETVIDSQATQEVTCFYSVDCFRSFFVDPATKSVYTSADSKESVARYISCPYYQDKTCVPNDWRACYKYMFTYNGRGYYFSI